MCHCIHLGFEAELIPCNNSVYPVVPWAFIALAMTGQDFPVPRDMVDLRLKLERAESWQSWQREVMVSCLDLCGFRFSGIPHDPGAQTDYLGGSMPLSTPTPTHTHTHGYIHYITLHYINYITLHYITLHHITLHTYIHTHAHRLDR